MIGQIPVAEYAVARLRHRVPAAARALGETENLRWGDPGDAAEAERPIYVTGLARGGTTIVTELLAALPGLATHRYRDRALPHAPVLWRSLQRGLTATSAAAQERAHADGLTVTADSPESAEEPLWRDTFGRRRLTEPPAQGDRFAAFYRAHVTKMIALEGGRRYLAKNTEHAGRLDYLTGLFAQPAIVVVVRAPGQQVASLMRQDARFHAWSAQDTRLRPYLEALGHCEFGPGRRPPVAADEAARAQIEEHWAAGDVVAGWARTWQAVNEAAVAGARRAPGRVGFLVYDWLLHDPLGVLRDLGSWLGAEQAMRPQLDALAARLVGHRSTACPLASGDVEAVKARTDPLWRRLSQAADADLRVFGAGGEPPPC